MNPTAPLASIPAGKVYVDAAIHPFRRMMMCHLMADQLHDLHAMADKIGVRRQWFQAAHRLPHYDICKSKRVLAVKHGAVELDRAEFVEISRRLIETQAMENLKNTKHQTQCNPT